MSQAKSYAAFSADKPLAPFTFDRREPRPDDVAIDIDVEIDVLVNSNC